MILSKNKNFRKNCQTIWFLAVTFWQTDSWPPGDCQPIVWMVCWWKGRYFLRLYTIASRIRLRTVYTGIADTLTIVRCKELYALAEFREQEYGYYDINLLGICLTTIMPIRGKQRAHDGQAPCPSWASSVPQLGRIDVRQMPQNFISSHQQTIQTIQNNHLVANSLYVNALRRKPDNLTVLTVFLEISHLTPIRDKIAISCMWRQIREFSSHAIWHELYIKNRKRVFCL